jgi:hypothetical protein
MPNAVKVRFVAGYGAAAAVPACVKHWMALHVKAAWDNRDMLVVGAAITKLPSNSWTACSIRARPREAGGNE